MFGRFCRKKAFPYNNLQNAECEIHQLQSCVVVSRDENQTFGNAFIGIIDALEVETWSPQIDGLFNNIMTQNKIKISL